MQHLCVPLERLCHTKNMILLNHSNLFDVHCICSLIYLITLITYVFAFQEQV